MQQPLGAADDPPPGCIAPYCSAVRLVCDLCHGRISSVALLQFFIARIERFDGQIAAIAVRDYERAAARAHAADEARRVGCLWGPLHGLPMTVKGEHAVEGLPTLTGDDQAQVSRRLRGGAPERRCDSSICQIQVSTVS